MNEKEIRADAITEYTTRLTKLITYCCADQISLKHLFFLMDDLRDYMVGDSNAT